MTKIDEGLVSTVLGFLSKIQKKQLISVAEIQISKVSDY
jgi:hypothetical protein